MKPPRCRLCTKEHWGSCDFNAVINKDANAINKAGPRKRASKVKVRAGNPKAKAAKKLAPKRPKKDYNEYMRKYMKQWRKKRAAKIAAAARNRNRRP